MKTENFNETACGFALTAGHCQPSTAPGTSARAKHFPNTQSFIP